MDRMLKVKDIQKNLGVSKDKAYTIIRTKGFPKIKIGRRYYIPEKEYEKWLKEHLRRKVIL